MNRGPLSLICVRFLERPAPLIFLISFGPQRAVEPEDAILRTRTYDLSITYDKYYQVSAACPPP